PEAGYRRWQEALEELTVADMSDELETESVPPIEVKKLTCEATPHGCRIWIELDQIPPATAESLQLVVAGRKLSTFFVSSSAQVSRRRFGHRIVLAFDVHYAGFSESPDETFDVYLRRAHDLWTAKRRIQTPRRFRAVQAGSREWYSTKHGNLSVRTSS